MTLAADAMPRTDHLFYFNPFGLTVVLDVPDRYGASRLSINDVIYMLAQGLCPPRFTHWYSPRHYEYQGRYAWKFQPEYASTAQWDLATLEDYLHVLQIGLRPETDLELYFFLHATDWGYIDNPVFLLMQQEVDGLVKEGFSWEKRQNLVDKLENCACEHFKRYMTLNPEMVLADKKARQKEVALPSDQWHLVDEIINPDKFPFIAMVLDRARQPIPDLNDLVQAQREKKILPGYIPNPYDMTDELHTDHLGLLWIVPEYIQTPHYNLLGLIAKIREAGITGWDHICFLVHLSNYGCVGNAVIGALETLKKSLDLREAKGGRPITNNFNYLKGIILNMKSFRIVAPRATKK